jgi:protein SCO1
MAWMLPAAAMGQQQDSKPEILKRVGFDQMLNAQVPLDLRFNDETGRPVRLGDYFGKRPVILAMVYYECPMLCTLVLNGLVTSLRDITFNAGRDFDVVAVSINPREGPALASAKKEAYTGRYRRPATQNGWHFLTGADGQIGALAAAIGFRYAWDEGSQQYAHAAGITVLTPAGRVARYFYGVDYAPRDVRLGLVEASQNRIGNPVDQVLLYCFHYDPVTGKYHAVIQNIIRLAGSATVLALAALLFVMFRRERRKNFEGTPQVARR